MGYSGKSASWYRKLLMPLRMSVTLAVNLVSISEAPASVSTVRVA
jgi:hypothetical protein